MLSSSLSALVFEKQKLWYLLQECHDPQGAGIRGGP
jgi:hypothetical protein